MQPRTRANSAGNSNKEVPDEIAVFIIEGTHRLATISINDYGFLMSARMAQSYLRRALPMLESKRGFDKAFFNEVSLLKAMAQTMTGEYAQFEAFCSDCERFNRLKTKGWIEWISKWAVRAIARQYRVTISHYLAYKIRRFHSRLCTVLTET
jgi:hypothetical protein